MVALPNYNGGYKKEPDPLSKPIKYLKNRIEGKDKSQAQREAGYKDVNHPQEIEATKTYQAGLAAFLMKEIDVAKEHNKNIKQDKDKGAKNKAIDMYYRLKGTYPKEEGEFEAGDLQITVKKR